MTVRTALLGAVSCGIGLLAACSTQEAPFPAGTYGSVSSPSITMTFSDDGSFVVVDGAGGPGSTGTYSVDGNEITWRTDTYCRAHGAESATYVWSWDATTLTMTSDGDDCAERVTILAKGLTQTFPRVSYGQADDPAAGQMTFNPDGTFALRPAGEELLTSGTYAVTGDILTFLTDSYCKEAGAEQGTYTAAWDGTTLRLTAKDDPCADRVSTLSEPMVPYSPSPSPSG